MDLPGVETGFDAATEASGGFGDRVMAALADDPAPSATGFLLPLRRVGLLPGLPASFRQAFVATRGSGRPLLARAAALAYVLVLAIAALSVTGAASLGAAGALGLLGPRATPSPLATTPPSTLTPPTAPPPSTVPVSPAPSPSPSTPATILPTATDDHGGAGAEPSDDHGDNAGPDTSSSGSDSSGYGSESESGG
jgi:hypothetical protein